MSRNDPAGGLRREVGPWSFAALTVNCVVGAGVLGLPGRVFALGGAWTQGVLVAAGLLALGVALCLAELAGRFDGPGGPALYLDRAFGPVAGFVGGWLSWIATVLGAASLLDLLVDMAPLGRAARTPLILLAAAALTAFTAAGARRSTTASLVLTVVKLVLLAAVALGGLAGPAAPATPPTGAAHPLPALLLVFFAFVGFERSTALAGEVRGARVSVPLALVAAMGVIGLLYLGIFAACLRDLPDLARSGQPVAELAGRRFGPAAGVLEAGAALVVLGTLVSQWITGPRLLLALAGDGRLPSALARLHPRRGAPDAAIALTGASAALLALLGGFAGAAAVSSAARLAVFIGCAAAVIRVRRRADAPPARFRLPGGDAIAAAVVLCSAGLLARARVEGLQLAGLVSIGGLAWLLTALIRRRRAPSPA